MTFASVMTYYSCRVSYILVYHLVFTSRIHLVVRKSPIFIIEWYNFKSLGIYLGRKMLQFLHRKMFRDFCLLNFPLFYLQFVVCLFNNLIGKILF